MSSTVAEFILPILTVLSTAFTLILLALPSRYNPSPTNALAAPKSSKSGEVRHDSIQVLVLGDIGRSPRMQYHALSIASHGGSVVLVGYMESEPLPELQAHPHVEIVPLPPAPKILQTSNKLLFLLFGPLKVMAQVWSLWVVLGYRTPASKWLLVQNPPSIPTLLVATVICFLRNTRLVIDWHNLGYSILALKLGTRHPLVQIARWYENIFANLAYSHLAVTNVMSKVLRKGLPAKATVLTLHDRPAAMFQPLATSSRVSFLSQHALTAEYFEAFAEHKLKIVVSSTSWTPDEDFAVLLDALCQYSVSASSSSSQLPDLLVIITGKGPQQAYYMAKINKLRESGRLKKVTIKTAWLSFKDYASLLASADLGVSLHTSSSGIDLPMKVVDMFGAGLPVLGFNDFEAWAELVHEDINGKGFSSSKQMADILEAVLEPSNVQLDRLREGAILESTRRWSAEWDPVVGRLFGLVE